MQTATPDSSFITPLSIDGMNGRMLRVPAAGHTSRQILALYGHHASLERILGVAEGLAQHGTVTVPDFPGFGGMDSFYTIGKRPTLDNLADYVAAFIQQKFEPEQKLTVIGMSFGFVVATRMLQRHPQLQSQVELLVSMVGLVHYKDFRFSRLGFAFWRTVARLGSLPPLAWFTRHVLFQAPVIRTTYRLVADRHVKLKDADPAERERRIRFEITLWQINEARTYFQTALAMLKLNLLSVPVNLPVYHVAVARDRYFNNKTVEAHLRRIFSEVHILYSGMKEGHAPTVVADAATAASMFPDELRDVLAAAE